MCTWVLDGDSICLVVLSWHQVFCMLTSPLELVLAIVQTVATFVTMKRVLVMISTMQEFFSEHPQFAKIDFQFFTIPENHMLGTTFLHLLLVFTKETKLKRGFR